jgi:hypothetical protein
VNGTSYKWTIHKQYGNKRYCFIKVVGYDSLNVKVGADTSDAPFTIEVVKLISPNGGENLLSGSRVTINWNTYPTKETVTTTEIYYRTDDSLPWILLKTRSGNPGSVGWIIPNVDEPENNCKVKVVLRNSLGYTLGADASDSYFTIQPPE